MACYGMARRGIVWCGMVWHCMARYGMIVFKMVWLCVGAACTCAFAHACVDVWVHESVYLNIQVCGNATLCHAMCFMCIVVFTS